MGTHFSKDQQTPSLTELIQQEMFEQAIEIIQSGIDVNGLFRGESPLRAALFTGEPTIFKRLTDLKAKLIPKLPLKRNVLHVAVDLGHYKLARSLLQDRAFRDLRNSQDANEQTPLHLATINEDSDMVALLIKFNANLHIRDKNGMTAKEIALSVNPNEEVIEQFNFEDMIHKPRTSDLSSTIRLSTVLKEDIKIDFDPLHAVKEEPQEEGVPPIRRVEQFVTHNSSIIPLISSADLVLEENISKGSTCLVYKGKWRGTQVCIKQFREEF